MISDAREFPWPVDEPYKLDPTTGYPTPQVSVHLHSQWYIATLSLILNNAFTAFAVLFHCCHRESPVCMSMYLLVHIQDCAKHAWEDYQFSQAAGVAYQNLYNNSNGENSIAPSLHLM